MDVVEARAWSGQGARHPWEQARLAVVLDLLARTQRPTAVLDVGCGDAFVLRGLAAREPGARFVGVDPALDADAASTATMADGATGTITLVKSLDDVGLPRGAVSHVLLLDVLEHAPDDAALLRQVLAAPCVAPGAWVLVTVPAHPALFSAHDRVLGHHRRYQAPQLRALLERAGLQLVESGGLFASLVLPRLAEKLGEEGEALATALTARLRDRLGARLGDRLRHAVGRASNNGPNSREEATGVASWRGGPLLTRALTEALALDFQATQRLARAGVAVPGLSLYAVCRVP